MYLHKRGYCFGIEKIPSNAAALEEHNASDWLALAG
jgi:hypothetical protein